MSAVLSAAIRDEGGKTSNTITRFAIVIIVRYGKNASANLLV
jgi:hypothetical protein